MIKSETTVREIALKTPRATKLFEKLRIDYCCGGNQTLTEAASSAGVNINDILRMLEDEKHNALDNVSIDFQRVPIRELIAHILTTHHTFTKEEMTRLEPLMSKVIAAHGENHPELYHLGKLFSQLCEDLNPHMFKEEQILFPYILGLEEAVRDQRKPPFAPFGTVKNPVRMMMMEHDTAGEILRKLRHIASDYTAPSDGCVSYELLCEGLASLEADLHQHIHLENNLLFPRAIEMEANLVALTET